VKAVSVGLLSEVNAMRLTVIAALTSTNGGSYRGPSIGVVPKFVMNAFVDLKLMDAFGFTDRPERP
jgi:hypothetical protein